MNQGLLSLRPELGEPYGGTWADRVIHLRKVFGLDAVTITETQLQAAINIGHLFGPQFRLPITATFIALVPRRKEDVAILRAFGSAIFTGSPLLPIT